MPLEQLKFNQCLIELHDSLSKGRAPQAHHALALQEKELLLRLDQYSGLGDQVLRPDTQLQDQWRLSLVKTYQALLYLASFQLQESGACLEESLELIQSLKEHEFNCDELLRLELQVLLHLAFLCLYVDNYEQATLVSQELFSLLGSINNLKLKAKIVEQLVGWLCQVQQAGHMSEIEFTNVNTFPPAQQGLIYNHLGLLSSFSKDSRMAVYYYQRALDVFINANQVLLVLMTIQIIINLKNQEQVGEYVQLYQQILEKTGIRREQMDQLMEGYSRRLQFGQDLLSGLFTLQRELSPNLQKSLAFDPRFYRQAVLLKVHAQVQAMQTQSLSQESQLALQQLLLVAQQIEDDSPDTLATMAGDTFVVQSVNDLKAKVNIIRRFMIKCVKLKVMQILAHRPSALEQMYSQQIEQKQGNRMVDHIKERRREAHYQGVVEQQCVQQVQYGEYLIKCHKDSSGRARKFFRVQDQWVEWSTSHTQIENTKKVERYSLGEVHGLCYGKSTRVLRKKYNQCLEPWRCFSLLLGHRSLDFYVPEESIRFWVLGISRLLGPKAPFSIGLFFWRKLKLILLGLFCKQHPDHGKIEISFARCVVSYGRSSL